MTAWVREILERYGQTVTLETAEGETEARAFLQPVQERQEQLPTAATELGWVDGRLWLYLGKAAVRAGDTVLWNGRRFRVRSGRPHYIGTELSHWRAVLERAREAE